MAEEENGTDLRRRSHGGDMCEICRLTNQLALERAHFVLLAKKIQHTFIHLNAEIEGQVQLTRVEAKFKKCWGQEYPNRRMFYKAVARYKERRPLLSIQYRNSPAAVLHEWHIGVQDTRQTGVIRKWKACVCRMCRLASWETDPEIPLRQLVRRETFDRRIAHALFHVAVVEPGFLDLRQILESWQNCFPGSYFQRRKFYREVGRQVRDLGLGIKMDGADWHENWLEDGWKMPPVIQLD